MTDHDALTSRIEGLRQRDSQSEPDDYWTGWNDALDHVLRLVSVDMGLRKAAQAVVDDWDTTLCEWTALAECGHDDPFCPEMEAIRDPLRDKRWKKAEAALRAALGPEDN